MFWKDYNSLSDDIRDDEEVKAELHQRVEDLKENLWKICDVKKAESEKERESIMNNGWLPDKIGFMINHYITLMQAWFWIYLKDHFQILINLCWKIL